METSPKILGATNTFVALLVIGISIPLVYHKIPMNKVYGIRFKKSFESEEKWYTINVYGGKQLILWLIPLLLLGVATFFLPLVGRQFWVTMFACAPLIYFVPALICYLYTKRR